MYPNLYIYFDMDPKENLPASSKNVDEFDLNWWVRHRERTLEHKWYAIGRLDLLVISISGGGLYIVFEILKFLKTEDLTVDTYLLKNIRYCIHSGDSDQFFISAVRLLRK